MAPFYVGVQENFATHFTTGPSSATQTNIDEVHAGAIRMIYNGNQGTEAKNHCQMLVGHGKFVIPTFDASFSSITSATFKTQMNDFATKLAGIASVIEIGNEPSLTANEWNPNGTGPYFARLREAIPIFHAKGIQVIMGCPPTGPDVQFLAAANANAGTSLWTLLDGVGIHPYSRTPTIQLGLVNSLRSQLDGYGAAAAALPLWITEFGWSTQDHVGQQGNLVVPDEQTQQDHLEAAYNNWIANAAALKLRAACWYIYSDTSRNQVDMFNFCGIRTDVDPGIAIPTATPPVPAHASYNPAPWRYKNVAAGDDPQNPTTGIKAMLDSFGAGTGLTGVSPDVITNPATNPTPSGATLNGTVDPNGTPTTAWFEYGPTAGYGFVTPTQVVGSGDAPVSLTADVGGLAAGTWHFRLRASSSAGSGIGGDRTFATVALPTGPGAITGGATEITAKTAKLHGVVDPHGLPTTYHFEWGSTAAYGNSTPERALP